MSSDTTRFPPVETKKANTSYKPAISGQTRIGGIKTITPYNADKIADKLGFPWAIIPMPDGRLLITEKKGSMQILDANGKLVYRATVNNKPQTVNLSEAKGIYFLRVFHDNTWTTKPIVLE